MKIPTMQFSRRRPVEEEEQQPRPPAVRRAPGSAAGSAAPGSDAPPVTGSGTLNAALGATWNQMSPAEKLAARGPAGMAPAAPTPSRYEVLTNPAYAKPSNTPPASGVGGLVSGALRTAGNAIGGAANIANRASRFLGGPAAAQPATPAPAGNVAVTATAPAVVRPGLAARPPVPGGVVSRHAPPISQGERAQRVQGIADSLPHKPEERQRLAETVDAQLDANPVTRGVRDDTRDMRHRMDVVRDMTANPGRYTMQRDGSYWKRPDQTMVREGISIPGRGFGNRTGGPVQLGTATAGFNQRTLGRSDETPEELAERREDIREYRSMRLRNGPGRTFGEFREAEQDEQRAIDTAAAETAAQRQHELAVARAENPPPAPKPPAVTKPDRWAPDKMLAGIDNDLEAIAAQMVDPVTSPEQRAELAAKQEELRQRRQQLIDAETAAGQVDPQQMQALAAQVYQPGMTEEEFVAAIMAQLQAAP